jgi:hypothetical protein
MEKKRLSKKEIDSIVADCKKYGYTWVGDQCVPMNRYAGPHSDMKVPPEPDIKLGTVPASFIHRFVRWLCGIAVLLLFCSCGMKPVQTMKTSNPEAKVDKLFEVDECSVYRFSDNGSYKYLVKCKGVDSARIMTERE